MKLKLHFKKNCIKVLSTFVFCYCSFFSFGTIYYVNDASLAGDVFCTAIGQTTNNGLSVATPKLSFKALWNAYGPSGTNVLTSGDEIKIDAGTYATETNITINKDGISIIGAGISLTFIDNGLAGTSTNFFLYINANNIVLRDMTIKGYENNGTQTPGHSGQAVTIGGSAALKTGILIENVSFNSNGQSGGNPALSVLGNSNVILRGGGSFCNTAGTMYTGGVEAFGVNLNLLIENYILSYNYKEGAFDGGGLRVEGDATTLVTVKNTRISHNEANIGGGISQRNGVLKVYDCIIDNNSAGQTSTTVYGGAFKISAGTASFSRCKFSNNFQSAGTLRGGAIAARYVTDPNPSPFSSNKIITLTLDSCIFENNTPGANGFDIYGANGSSNACNITARDCQFLSGGNYNIVSDATSPASSINVTYFGTLPTKNGTVTRTLSSNVLYTADPTPPDFTGTCGSISILPVELLSYKVSCDNKQANLLWTTASERNNAYFVIEKADFSYKFYPLAEIQGANNSSSQKNYVFNDFNAIPGISYYRLSQVDFNGDRKVLGTHVLNNSCLFENSSSCFFNTADNELIIHSEFMQHTDYSIKIVNSLGQIIHESAFLNQNNKSQHNLNLKDNLSASVYFVYLESKFKKEVIKVILN